MIPIFSDTTTWLSEQFLLKIPSSVLTLAIENLNTISGLDCRQIKGEIKLTGQWQDLLTAHALLEHCLDVNNDDENEDKKCDVDIVDEKNTDNSSFNQTPPVVTIKKEKDAEWTETEQNAHSDIKPLRDTRRIDYADDDTQDIDIGEAELPAPTVSKRKGKFQCTKCNYTGRLEKQLINHMNRKHVRKYKCGDCGKKYGFKADLSRHKSEVHGDRDKYFCNICNKYLKTKGYIEDHMQLHNDNYVYHCKTCDKSFSTKLIFSKHIKIKHPKMKKIIDELQDIIPTAEDANTPSVKDENSTADSGNDSEKSEEKKTNSKGEPSFETSEQMMMNIMSGEEDDKVLHETEFFKVSLKRGRNRGRPRIKSFYDDRTEFPCHLCDYVGKKECHLEYHIKRNHSQKLICEICNKQFGYNWDLKRHREQVHAEASFFCHICSKAYKVKKSFDEHLRSHEEGYVKSRFPCTECDKSFSAKQVLDNHIKIKHLGVKQKEKQRYLCQTCGQEFYHKYSYLSHMNKHQGLLPYSCDICGKKFASEHSVREHQIVHSDERNFCCRFCSKTFKTSSALKAHEAIHSNSKDFKCSVCGKGFVQKQSLLRHERIHSGYKPYKCRLCERPFTDSATVRKHMILVHKKDPHNWQGDVISDLKRPREFWPDDWDVNAKNVKIVSQEPKKESSRPPPPPPPPQSDNSNNMYDNNPSNLTPIPDTQPQMPPEPSMMGHNMARPQPLSLVQPTSAPMQMMQNSGAPVSSGASSLGPMSQDPMGSHSSAVEMAAASILNLSQHLPPMPTPMSHMSPVPMDGQMPSILNLSTMHNMNYNHHNQ